MNAQKALGTAVRATLLSRKALGTAVGGAVLALAGYGVGRYQERAADKHDTPLAVPSNSEVALTGRRGSEFIAKVTSPLGEEADDATPFIDIQGWGSMAKRWNPAAVQVCWENPEPQYANERSVVQAAVVETWDLQSSLAFQGFQACTPGAPGIHVGITDGSARTFGTGTDVNGRPSGIVLNFDYASWHPECRQNEARRLNCIRANAVHEFGHAIGLVHEQNRDDTPDTCDEPPDSSRGDKILTPWDPESVMNYCNKKRWLDGGKLSQGDISSVQQMYGAAV